MENYSLSDLAAVNDKGGFGGSGAWVLILLFAMIFGWGNGFGGNNGTAASQADIQRAIDLNSIQQGQANIAADVQRSIYEVTGATKDAAYNNLGEIRDVQTSVASNGANIINALTAMQANQQNCCCETQRAIDGVNYNLATQSAAIQANTTAQTQKILDAISTNRMADMQNQINQLQLQNAVSGVVRYPMATTYGAGNSCFASGCGCGNI